jgi:hypothetical protein
MSFLNKLIGSSKFQEEFTKCIGFNWTLIISNIIGLEYTKNGNTIKSNYNQSCLLFDFDLKELFIAGDIVDEVYGGKKHFVIVREETINSEIIFYFSFLENKNMIVMKCTVMRSNLLFEGTLSNWTCKIPNSDYLNLKQTYNK